MKSLKSLAILIIASVIFTAAVAKNNTENTIPAAVVTAFAAKYPKAEIKSWDITNGEYVAKATDDSHKYLAVFDKQGNWIKTSTKQNWPWRISPEVKSAFKKTKHGAWHIYAMNVVEKPSGQYVQLLVDDANPTPDTFQNIKNENWLLEFKATGELVEERNINTAP